MTNAQRFAKRAFDIAFSLAILLIFGWLILLALVAASIDTREFGLFSQKRIGKGGKPFRLFKIRTMRSDPLVDTHVTTGSDPRITPLGRLLRRAKVDELPQFVNVLLGDMSVVGPRPDVSGFADALTGEDRLLLTVRPGVTGPASLAFRDEERVLEGVEDPERYNREVIWPAKVRMNCDYVRHYSLTWDIKLVLETLLPRKEGAG